MQLKTYEAVRLGFVLDENKQPIEPEPYRNKSSFDAEVKEILCKDNKNNISRKNSIDNLQPQDSAYLISKQYIRVPEGYIAYVFLKNRMSQRGLLALNTGIIDQSYYGPISTLIINLSNSTRSIPDHAHPNDITFFRIVFHKVDSDEHDENNLIFPTDEECKDYEEYISFRKGELLELPKTFLDSREIEERVKSEVTAKTREFSLNRLLGGVAIVGLLFSLVSFGRDYFFTWKFNLNKTSEQVIENKYKSESMDKDIRSLKLELEELKKKLNNIEKLDKHAEDKNTFNQHINITVPNATDKDTVKKEVVESLFAK